MEDSHDDGLDFWRGLVSIMAFYWIVLIIFWIMS